MTTLLPAPDAPPAAPVATVASPASLGPGRADEWRELAERSPVALAVADAHGVVRYANPAAAALLLGDEPRITVGLPLAGRFVTDTDEARDVWPDVVRELRGAGDTGRHCLLRPCSGEPVRVALHVSAVRWDGRAAVQLVFRDISRQQVVALRERHSAVRWDALFDSSPVAIGLTDDTGRFVHANRALCTLLGRPLPQIIGHTSPEFTHPGDQDLSRRAGALIDAAADGIARVEKRYVRPDGEIRWAWLSATHVPGPDGTTWTLAHIQDVTDRQSAEQLRRDSETDLAAVMEVVRAVLREGDARRTVVDAARRLAQADTVWLVEPDRAGRNLAITAATDDFLLGLTAPVDEPSLSGAVMASGEPMFVADCATHPQVSPTLLREFRPRAMLTLPVRAAGSSIAVLVLAWQREVSDPDGRDDRRLTVAAMLADQAALALRQAFMLDELQELSRTDALTALPNRRHWDDSLTRLLAQAGRTQRPCTVALVDLDHFKRFNDTHGHSAGDVLLREFSTTARTVLRAGDEIARWGGEEFAIALPDCPVEEAATVLERVRTAVPRGQTCSIGHATWDGSESAGDLLHRADGALYAAKREGRNRVRPA